MKFLNSTTKKLRDFYWEVDDKHGLQIEFPKPSIARVTFLKNEKYRLNRTWSIQWNQENFSYKGQKKSKLPSGSPSRDIRFAIHDGPLNLRWFYKNKLVHSDRPTNAFAYHHTGGWSHYSSLAENVEFYGLGEKAGALNHRGKVLTMKSIDAMGYDAETTDPLYKHFPFYIKRIPHPKGNLWLGVFYDNFSTSQFNLGREVDNYHDPYYTFSCEDGDLDYYLIFGDTPADITRSFHQLTGTMAMPPRWSLRYSGSSMYYTDQPDAEKQVLGFAEKCREHKIPCSSFQLSSGYTSIGNKRYVFQWNSEKFPSPKMFAVEMRERGLRLAANIKPVLLKDHPLYRDVKKKGLFISDGEKNKPELSRFWGDQGSHLDFTNPKTIQWWKEQITSQLLNNEITATWNDNNEYEVWDGQALCHGFGKKIPVGLIRPVQSLLMMAASHEAQTTHSPNQRPWLISRSGMPGMQQFCQTWSGDNRTDWKTMEYNLYMALNLSISGVYNIGHDIGGFAGPAPDPELFVRWLEHGIFYPRLTIHSWNSDGSVTEPWMYPEHKETIAKILDVREQLMDYLYTQVYCAYKNYTPILRPLFYDFGTDPQCFNHTDQFMFGPDIMVASQFEQNQTQRKVYLPEWEGGWYHYPSLKKYNGGETLDMDMPLGQVSFFIRGGCALPMGDKILLCPGVDGQTQSTKLYFDDGESLDYQRHEYKEVTIDLTRMKDSLQLKIDSVGDYQSHRQYNLVCLDSCETEQDTLEF